ncbi:MAG: hypothetical protein Q8J74_03805, partial [Candidatus Didemnitutus sp.]|nr:hypothetical protein [Candidatus Didemnitutus sp.]
MVLLLAHTICLLGASGLAAGRVVRPGIERILATLLLAWGNIVVTSLLLASLSRLGEPAWFFRTSVLLAIFTWLVLRRLRLEPVQAETPKPHEQFNPWLLGAFVLTLIPLVWASLRIAGTYVPNNYDSLTYHLPRTMFYLGQDSLAHFATGNPRQIFFPFNYNLLQLCALIYSPPLQFLNFINLTAWAGAGLAVYRLARQGACSVNSALIATWLALTSTQILAQATATTNDLPTAAGLLGALVFALRWRLTRLTRDALLGGLAAGLTAGSKLTIVFFGPVAGLILLTLAWQHWRRGDVRGFFTGIKAWLLPGLLAFALASPFALINLWEKGEWINKTYDFTLNRPFSLGCVVQTSEAYLVQLFLEPLHRFTFDLQFTSMLNTWGQRTIFPNWNEAFAFSPLYLFPPDLNEDHVWFGFTGPLVFLGAIYCLVRFRRVSTPLVWLAALGLGWLATYFLLNKWSLYNQRYFVLAILVMSPCLGAAIEAGAARFPRSTRFLLTTLAATTVWLAGIYLFSNSSRPYAPLWAGTPVPQALPTLPPVMVQRVTDQPRVNVISTDGNERIFLLMALGRNQRFTSFDQTDPSAYNVYSHWGFPRKVAYSNIEQLSSYTIVEFPDKATAGVEFLGTIGQGQPALDYYGLVPQADQTPAGQSDRNVLVEFHYAPRAPDRYRSLQIKVRGLNLPDHARLIVGVDYDDQTSEELATFSETGEAIASVTRSFRRFTLQIRDAGDGRSLGATDLPYLFRDQPPEVETPHDPLLLFSSELVASRPGSAIATEGLASPEGPYPQWNLPMIRWVKTPVLRLEIPAGLQQGLLELQFELCLHARESADIDVVFNGEIAKSYRWEGSTRWLIQKLTLKPQPGVNVIEFRNVVPGTKPDWLDYLARYPDVKAYLDTEGIPHEQGAQEHYNQFGKREGRVLHLQRRTASIPEPHQLYYLFRSLKVDAFRNR